MVTGMDTLSSIRVVSGDGGDLASTGEAAAAISGGGVDLTATALVGSGDAGDVGLVATGVVVPMVSGDAGAVATGTDTRRTLGARACIILTMS